MYSFNIRANCEKLKWTSSYKMHAIIGLINRTLFYENSGRCGNVEHSLYCFYSRPFNPDNPTQYWEQHHNYVLKFAVGVHHCYLNTNKIILTTPNGTNDPEVYQHFNAFFLFFGDHNNESLAVTICSSKNNPAFETCMSPLIKCLQISKIFEILALLNNL